MNTDNLTSLQTVPVQSQVQPLIFILPKSQSSLDILLHYIYTRHFIDEVAKSKCRNCKVRHTRRLCAQGEFGKHGNPCTIAFDFCPQCLRVKPDTPHQRKMMELVRNLKPLDPVYVKRIKPFCLDEK